MAWGIRRSFALGARPQGRRRALERIFARARNRPEPFVTYDRPARRPIRVSWIFAGVVVSAGIGLFIGMSDDRPPRPRDFALLGLAALGGPPRKRPRDAQSDLAGIDLMRRLLDRLAALDPDPDDLDAALLRIVAELGAPTGPARALAAQWRDDWHAFRASPAAWGWLVSEAIEAGADRHPRRRGGRDDVP